MIKIATMMVLLYPFTKMWGLVGAGFAILLAVILVFPYLIHILHTKTALKLRHFYISFACCFLATSMSYYSCSLLNLDRSWLFIVGCLISLSVVILILLSLHLLFGVGPGWIIKDAYVILKKKTTKS